MNALPPLRTVRDAPAPSGQKTSSPISATTPPPSAAPTFDLPGVPKPAREFLGELIAGGLLKKPAVEAFVRELGTQAVQLTARERTADALVALNVLTRYQATRALNGLIRGLLLGPYRVLDRIGSGTVGVVFLAEHVGLGRKVAVKVLSADSTTPLELIDRFTTEVRVMARLDHPHVVTVYDSGVLAEPGSAEPSLHYLAMELVPGGDLENYVYANGPQSIGLVCEWGRQAATGLRAAHAAGLVHRDIKPSNLLLNEARRVKLIDFGLAREFSTSRTRSDTLLGSVEFAAPEQLDDAPTAGPPADVYSLGATLFWLLSGQLPYPKERTVAAAVAAVRNGPPRKLKMLSPDTPAALDALVGRMLARNPADRPTPAEAAAALAGFAVPAAHPAVKGAVATQADGEEMHLRAAVRQLEDELTSTNRALDSARAAVMTSLAAASAMRPGESVGHQQRMAEYVRALAAGLATTSDWSMFIDPRAVDDLARAAAAHDLGLVGVPDEVLSTPNKLTPVERDKFISHPVIGAAVLDTLASVHGSVLPGLRMTRAVVRHHHEKWDGSGYPDKLAGKAIPPAARVVALADAYDSLRKGHPHRPGVSHTDAVAQIVRQSGAAFDPAVVRAFGACAVQFERIYAAQEPVPVLLEAAEEVQ